MFKIRKGLNIWKKKGYLRKSISGIIMYFNVVSNLYGAVYTPDVKTEKISLQIFIQIVWILLLLSSSKNAITHVSETSGYKE